MEYTLTSENIGTLCRVCLTSTKHLVPLLSPVNEDVSEDQHQISELLEAVTCNVLVLDASKFPDKICQICLSLLKISYQFQTQFYNSQKRLEKVFKQTATTQLAYSDRQTPACVELICGKNKFDLNDVIVVEDTQEESFSYQGFLNNLGSEVSASFVKPNHSIQPQNLNNLSVRRFPEESKLMITDNGRIIKTMFECVTCKALFSGKTDLDSHRDSKHGRQQYVCEKCGHVTSTASALYHHLNSHKNRRFKCDQCDKKFANRSRLKCHKQAHANERPFLCSVCGKTFNYSVALKCHMRLHSDEKLFVCNFCGLKFRMSSTLKRHLRVHTKEKPYGCVFCDKGFSSNGEKVAHERSHLGIRPYKCQYCDKSFTKSGNLRCHYLAHRGPHACGVCSRTFVEVRFLKTHVLRVHKEEETG